MDLEAETDARPPTPDTAAPIPHSAFRIPHFPVWPQVLLFLLLWFSYCYFSPGPNWGTVSRMNLVMAVVDDHSLSLDRFCGTTGDFAFARGHYRHEKAPGGAFLGLLPYRVFSWVAPRPAMAKEPAWSTYYGRALYVTACLSTGLLSALAGVVLFRLVLGLFGNAAGAMLTALIYGLGSQVLVYAGQFQSHQMAGALVVFALYFAFRVSGFGFRVSRAGPSVSCASLRTAHFALRTRLWPLVSGFCLSYAVATEYQDVFLALAVAVYLFATLRPRRRIVWFILGAIPPAVMVAVFNYLSFGEAFTAGYAYVEAPQWRAVHSTGLLGFGAPRFDAWRTMLVAANRGLVVFSPVWLLAIPGALLWARARRHRAELILCLATVVLFPVFLSGFRPILTGHQFGPRFLVPMLPIVALLIAPVVTRWRGIPALVLGVASCVLALAGAAVNPEFKPSLQNPIFDYLLPNLVLGNYADTTYGLSLTLVFRPIEYRPFNLGMVLGLRGLPSLLPLLAVWAVAFGLLAWMLQTKRSTSNIQHSTSNPQ